MERNSGPMGYARSPILKGMEIVAHERWTNEWRQDVDDDTFAPSEDYGMATSGSIGLQDHGNPVWVRDRKIRPLSGDDAPADDA